ncbi:MAG: hypothetical protein MUE44_31185 [Oscillatoriaceae cyanobacterium Prado104]|jgi:chromosome segregation ATPase|nr:hypothetical protein [Oscillatoriaceae cyanobacterium Prado104]
MALWAKNKADFSVAFTEDPADRTLLAAVEKELLLTKYQTFSNLCKQALWQFLSVSESATSASGFIRLEQRIAELAVKFAEFEHNVSAEEVSRLEGLEHHLNKLSAQLSQLQESVNSKFDRVSFAQVSRVVDPDAVESEPAIDNDSVSGAEVAPREETDPLLERLSSLLPQDF